MDRFQYYLIGAVYKLRALLTEIFIFKKLDFAIRNYSIKKYSIDPYLSISRNLKRYKTLKNTKNLIALEIGTGETIIIPILLKYFGYKKIYTFDIENLFTSKSLYFSSKMILSKLNSKNFKNKFKMTKLKFLKSMEKKDFLFLEKIGIYFINKLDDFEKNAKNKEKLVIFSNNVLEHIKLQELIKLVKKLKSFRPFKSVHRVDLTDHIGRRFKKLGPYYFRETNKYLWNLIFSNKYIFQNKLNSNQYKKIFTKNFNKTITIKKDFFKDKFGEHEGIIIENN